VWTHTTPESVGRDVETARKLAAQADPHDSQLAQRYVTALSRLERWLRDM